MDGYVFLAAGRKNLNVGDNARGLNGFVGQIFQKVFSIVDANHLSCIIDADIERTALSISEATDVGEVFVMPLFLVFRVLRFEIHDPYGCIEWYKIRENI